MTTMVPLMVSCRKTFSTYLQNTMRDAIDVIDGLVVGCKLARLGQQHFESVVQKHLATLFVWRD